MWRAAPADQHARPARRGVAHVGLDLLHAGGIDERADLHPIERPVAHRECAHERSQRLEKRIGD